MKLYVDDHPSRKTPAGWHRAWSVTEAIRILDTQKVEVVSIDHDISIRVSLGVDESGYSEPRPFASNETFEPVVRFLGARWAGFNMADRPRIILHTANQTAAQKMADILAGFDVTIVLGQPVNKYE